MVKFECPHCHGKEYSAWDSREYKRITCPYCKKEYRNPYYKPYFGGGNRDKHLYGCP